MKPRSIPLDSRGMADANSAREQENTKKMRKEATNTEKRGNCGSWRCVKKIPLRGESASQRGRVARIYVACRKPAATGAPNISEHKAKKIEIISTSCSENSYNIESRFHYSLILSFVISFTADLAKKVNKKKRKRLLLKKDGCQSGVEEALKLVARLFLLVNSIP